MANQKTKKSKPTPIKTPMFTAMNALRYQRQALIRTLGQDTGTHLLCYVAGVAAGISRDDTSGFVDMLYNVPQGEPVDLLLHTPGGDIDAAEKLVTLLRAKVGDEGILRIIVPDFAKSAGTLMALGANKIVMSDSSEIGTIDPQIWLKDGRGNEICHSVLHYLEAYEVFEKKVRDNQTDSAARAMFEKFDPATLHKFTAVRDRARTFAENLLKRQGVNWTEIANKLMDIKEYPSHGQMIGCELAKGIGLDIIYLPQKDEIWRRYWELYCHLRLAIRDDQKIFESSIASLVIDG
jgi:ATP-dependent protease ClpP protease subunit